MFALCAHGLICLQLLRSSYILQAFSSHQCVRMILSYDLIWYNIVPWSIRHGSVTCASIVRAFGVATATGGSEEEAGGDGGRLELRLAAAAVLSGAVAVNVVAA